MPAILSHWATKTLMARFLGKLTYIKADRYHFKATLVFQVTFEQLMALPTVTLGIFQRCRTLPLPCHTPIYCVTLHQQL